MRMAHLQPQLPYGHEELKSKLRVIPGFPKEGVNFVDITTLLKDPSAFRTCVDLLTDYFAKMEAGVDVIVGVEARGFILGSAVAYNLGVGFVPARKKGKLPSSRETAEYTLEYGSEFVEMHTDAVAKGQRVGIVDDLLATGGTAEATTRLVEKLGGVVVGLAFLVELDFLHGRDKLSRYPLLTLVHYEE
jgi:adenine phosphoribosyltransferase